jgi:hypothetical protein
MQHAVCLSGTEVFATQPAGETGGLMLKRMNPAGKGKAVRHRTECMSDNRYYV